MKETIDMNENMSSMQTGKCVGFVFTNYNNSSFTVQAVRSIFAAAGAERCIVVVIDNKSRTEEVRELDEAKSISANVHVVENDENIGYFPGLNIGIEYLRARFPEISLMVIGNNDLVFPADFFAALERNASLFEQYPVVSPDLLTLDGVHQNPHVLGPVSRLREIVWDAYFANYTLGLVIRKIAAVSRRFTERKDYMNHRQAGVINQGYGACYILTEVFFRKFGSLWAPTFLMGEEFYLTTQLEAQGHQVFYEPSIMVQHHDHATVSKVPSRKLWEYTREYHKIYRRFVNPYRKNMDMKQNYKDLA